MSRTVIVCLALVGAASVAEASLCSQSQIFTGAVRTPLKLGMGMAFYALFVTLYAHLGNKAWFQVPTTTLLFISPLLLFVFFILC